jgi:hypothetical protein
VNAHRRATSASVASRARGRRFKARRLEVLPVSGSSA